MFAVLYLSQPYQLKRQDIHDLRYFLYYSVLFVVYIPPDPISLCERTQINNFGFIPGKVFRDQARALYKMGENNLWQKGKMEEVNKEKAVNIKILDVICTKAGGSSAVPGFREALPRLDRP